MIYPLLALFFGIFATIDLPMGSSDNLNGTTTTTTIALSSDATTKLVTISVPQSQNIYAGMGNLNKIVNVIFATDIQKQTPTCILDKDTQNATFQGQASSSYVIACDLSRVSSSALSVGAHRLWVVRSPDLLQPTLQLQMPINLTILPDPISASTEAVTETTSTTSTTSTTTETSTTSITSATSTIPTTSTTATTSTTSTTSATSTAASTTVSAHTNPALNLTLYPETAKFADNLDEIQVELAENGTNLGGGKQAQGNGTNVQMECKEIVATPLDKLGDAPKCAIVSDGQSYHGRIQLGQNASIKVGDKLAVYSVKLTSADGANPSQFQAASIHMAKTQLPIGNATNPTIPVIKLLSDQPSSSNSVGISICSPVDSLIHLNATQNGGGQRMPLNCKWSVNVNSPNINIVGTQPNLDKLVAAQNACAIAISTKLLAGIIANISYISAPTAIEIAVTACNLASMCSAAQTIKFPIDAGPKMKVDILGLPQMVAMASARIPLTAKVEYTECGVDKIEPNISFSWRINGQLMSNTSVCTIEAFAFPAGSSIPVELIAVQLNAKVEANDTRTLMYQLQPIVPIVDSTSKSIPAGSSFQLDASASWSQNVRDWPLEHQWTCINLTNSNKQCQLDLGAPQHNGLLNMPAGIWQENGSFLFIDTIRDAVNATANLEVKIQVLPSTTPLIKLVADERNSMCIGFVHVQAFVRNPLGNGGNLLLEWSLMNGGDNQSTVVDLADIFPNKAVKNQSVSANSGQTIVLSMALPIDTDDDFPNWPGLLPDQLYTLRLSATNARGITAFADHQFRLESLPTFDKLLVTPTDSISSLDTLIQFQPTFGNHADANSTEMTQMASQFYRVRFGIRYLLTSNGARDVWSRWSTQSGTGLNALQYQAYLPTAWPQPHASCGDRVGYQGLMQICDTIWGRCVVLTSDNFTVGQLSMDTIGRAVYLLNDRLNKGDIFGSLELLDAVNHELCGQWRNIVLFGKILDQLNDQLENSTDSAVILETLQYAMRLAESASGTNLDEIMDILNQTKKAMSETTNVDNGIKLRNKREVGNSNTSSQPPKSTTATTTQTAPTAAAIVGIAKTSTSMGGGTTSMSLPTTTMQKKISETTGTTLLIAYDVLLGKDQNVVSVYLSNIGDILASFCTQVDSLIQMQAFGKSYTSVQAQGLVPGQPGFANQTFPLAGNRTKILSFDPNFALMFTSWWCGTDGLQTCTEICLASAVTSLQTFRDNEYMRQQFFLPQNAMLTVDQAVSNLYHVYLIDPLSGLIVANAANRGYFSIRINVTIENYQPSAYYRCFFYVDSQWQDSTCDSAITPRMAFPGAGTFQLLCTCHRAGGILGVFTVNPPTPPPYPAHNEVQLVFTLNTTQIPSTLQLGQFIANLSAATGLNANRFVALNATVSASSPTVNVSAKLRPPFRTEQLSNSYAMQALKRTIGCDGGFTAFDAVKVLNMSDWVVKRVLAGDKNARRIPLRIDRSLRELFGPSNSNNNNNNDSSQIAYRWTSTMARAMRISEFRFKKPTIQTGILFNFTITVNFDGESNSAYGGVPLTAEEVAKIIEEMTFYGELTLLDQRDQQLPVDPLSDGDVVELIAMNPTSPMTFILGSIVGVAITLSTLLIGTMVFLKIRCDRLIEQQNENMQHMRTIDLSRAAPINVMPNPHGMIGGMDEAAVSSSASDTVIFGRSRRRRLRGQTKISG